MAKNKVDDKEIKGAGEELSEKVLEALAKLGVVQDSKMEGAEGEGEGAEDSGFETVS